jgi:hypothetical protein
MTTLKGRLKRLEKEQRFQDWLWYERFLEGLTEEQLEAVASHWRFPEPMPEPLPWGSSRLDRLDRKSLLRLWEEDDRHFCHRSHDDLRVYAEKGYWPEQRMRPRYYLQDGCLWAEWQFQPDGEDQRERI